MSHDSAKCHMFDKGRGGRRHRAFSDFHAVSKAGISTESYYMTRPWLLLGVSAGRQRFNRDGGARLSHFDVGCLGRWLKEASP